jgi:hypothetical protein
MSDGLPVGLAALGAGLAAGQGGLGQGLAAGQALRGDGTGRLQELALLQRLMARQAPNWQIVGDQNTGYYRANPDTGEVTQLVGATAPTKPPTERRRIEGDQEVVEEWNPKQLKFVEVSRGPRWAPQTPGSEPLVEIPDPTSPTGSRMVTRAQATGQPGMPAGGGVEIVAGADGKLQTIRVGGKGGGATGDNTPVAPATRNDIEKDIVNLTERRARVNRIGETYKPEFQQLGTRFGMAWGTALDKLGVEIDPQTQKNMRDFQTFKSSAYNDLNSTLKELSGAAVTESEATRQLQVLPNPGEGIFDGDSPTAFESKLNESKRAINYALARKTYLLRNGIPHDFAAGNVGGIQLDDMPQIINGRAREIEADLRRQGVPDDQLDSQLMAKLKTEFGV